MSHIFGNLQYFDCAHWVYGYSIELLSIKIVIIIKVSQIFENLQYFDCGHWVYGNYWVAIHKNCYQKVSQIVENLQYSDIGYMAIADIYTWLAGWV